MFYQLLPFPAFLSPSLSLSLPSQSVSLPLYSFSPFLYLSLPPSPLRPSLSLFFSPSLSLSLSHPILFLLLTLSLSTPHDSVPLFLISLYFIVSWVLFICGNKLISVLFHQVINNPLTSSIIVDNYTYKLFSIICY